LAIEGAGFVTISADGSRAAECESDTLLWDIGGHQLLRRLSDTQDMAPCQQAAFSADGKYLAVSSWTSTLAIQAL
jgi:hypothetical protein